jgi:hypothetical protein
MRGCGNDAGRCARWLFPLALGFVAINLSAIAQTTAQTQPDAGGSAANARLNAPAGREAPSPGAPLATGNAKNTERLREGTRLIDAQGTLASVGADSVTFSPAGSKESYRVLENLALQRVGQVLDENRGPRQWIVSGLITEYRGSNYLLLTKAVIQLQEGDSAAAQ